jgi:mono/diheme cytochrome c family protein
MKNRQTILWTLVLIVLLLVGYGMSLVRRGFSAKDQPSAPELLVARAVRSLSIAASAKNQKNPLPATPDNIREGMEHFADHCAFCHGNNGSGDSEVGKDMYPKPPDMRQPETQNLSDGEIYSIIANGVRLTGMPASDHDVDDNWRLVLFVRHLPNLTPAEDLKMLHLNPNTDPDRAEPADDDDKAANPQAPEHHHHDDASAAPEHHHR